MSIHSKTPLRQIKRYGTKGDYKLVYTSSDAYNETTMTVTKGVATSVPLLAFAEDKANAQNEDNASTSGVYALLVAVDSDFNGDVPVNAHIEHESKTYNINNVQVHRVKNKITFVELTING